MYTKFFILVVYFVTMYQSSAYDQLKYNIRMQEIMYMYCRFKKNELKGSGSIQMVKIFDFLIALYESIIL